MNFSKEYNYKVDLMNKALKESLESIKNVPEIIVKAMEYSLLSHGKRLRPILLISANKLAGGSIDKCLPLALGIEMIHTYSLIHDDLPAMDDDDLRRGVPTNHVVFGEAAAILAGDALLNYAYEVMIKGALNAKSNREGFLAAVDTIATAAGVNGMIGGQVADLESEGMPVNDNTLNYIHEHKTGALITASLRAGVLAESDDKDLLDAVTVYGNSLGVAFQITDDILDVTGDPDVFGKSIGSDERSGKLTYPLRYGLDESKKMAKDYIEKAINAIKPYTDKEGFLVKLAKSILDRKK